MGCSCGHSCTPDNAAVADLAWTSSPPSLATAMTRARTSWTVPAEMRGELGSLEKDVVACQLRALPVDALPISGGWPSQPSLGYRSIPQPALRWRALVRA